MFFNFDNSCKGLGLQKKGLAVALSTLMLAGCLGGGGDGGDGGDGGNNSSSGTHDINVTVKGLAEGTQLVLKDVYNSTEITPYALTLTADGSAKLISGLKKDDKFELQIASITQPGYEQVENRVSLQNCTFNSNDLRRLNGSIEAASLNLNITCRKQALFTAETDSTGIELWATDGTADGSRLLADINPSGDANPVYLTLVGDKVFFRASDGQLGIELWITDGSEVSMVADIRSGEWSSSPVYLTSIGDKLFFRANDGTHGNELWVTDGTVTEIVKDISPGSGNSVPQYLTVVGDKLFFRATDGTRGEELWVTDGTVTEIVADIWPDTGGSSPDNLTVLGNKLFFVASDGTHGQELWVTDGTVTEIVADIRPGNYSSNPNELTIVGDKLFFKASDLTYGTELWVADGQNAPVLLELYAGTDSSFPQQITAIDGLAYFIAQDSEGKKLWKSDGTVFGTKSLTSTLGDEMSQMKLLKSGNQLYLVQSVWDDTNFTSTISFSKLVDNQLVLLKQFESNDPMASMGGEMEVKSDIAGLIFASQHMGDAYVLNTQTDQLLSIDLPSYPSTDVLGEFDGYVYLQQNGVLYKTDGSEDSSNSGFVKIEQVKALSGSTL